MHTRFFGFILPRADA